MPLLKLQFKPGVDKDLTNYSGEGGWVDTEKVRFRAGFPQKIGGWAKNTTAVHYGVCRSMYSYATTYQDNLILLGTNEKVYINTGNTYFDITPIRQSFATTATDNCFDTTDGSAVVNVNISSHGASDGDWVTFGGAVAAGGITADELNTEFKITLVDADNFTITVASAATSTVSGGGTAITAAFQISIGFASTTDGYGWSTSTWGRSTWGSGGTTPFKFIQRDWFFGNIDNDLVLNIREGTPYYWARGALVAPDNALTTRAVTLSAYITTEGLYTAAAAPVKVGQLLVSQQDKHVIAFGAVPLGSTDPDLFDPMLIRWADQDTPTQWTPASTNSAGDIRLSRGSKIVRAFPTRQEVLVLTDSNLYTLQFLGTTDVFGVQPYSDNISVMGPRAVSSSNDVVYWMGKDKFYVYDGRVRTLPCTLREHVFEDINLDQHDQVVCGTNEEWSEIWWFYPCSTSNWNDLYVVYNYKDNLWFHGTLGRTAWIDSSLQRFPLAAFTAEGAASGYLYNHEDGLDDDGSAMTAYATTNDVDLGEGDKYMLTKRVIPDVNFNKSTATTPEVTIQLAQRNFPGSASSSDVADTQTIAEATVGDYTDQVFIRARARQMAFKIQSDGLGVMWRLGSPRVEVREDGKR